MYRILYLPTGEYVNALTKHRTVKQLSSTPQFYCDHWFQSEDLARLAIHSHRVLYNIYNDDEPIFLNSSSCSSNSAIGQDLVPVYLLDVVEAVKI